MPQRRRTTIPYITTDSFGSGYQPAVQERRRTNTNIISDAKPNLYDKFSINREGGSAGANVEMTPARKDPISGLTICRIPQHRHRLSPQRRKTRSQFLPLWATSLKLPVDYFDESFVTPHLLMSLLHYPPQKDIGNRQYGIAPHTDNSLMTFFAQADVPGLAVRCRAGHWRAVDVIPGTLLINTGNLMVRWTNGEYLSTKHRVINTNAVDRYSIPVFFGPSGDALIECLSTCQGPDRPSQYEPITYLALRQSVEYATYD